MLPFWGILVCWVDYGFIIWDSEDSYKPSMFDSWWRKSSPKQFYNTSDASFPIFQILPNWLHHLEIRWHNSHVIIGLSWRRILIHLLGVKIRLLSLPKTLPAIGRCLREPRHADLIRKYPISTHARELKFRSRFWQMLVDFVWCLLDFTTFFKRFPP